MTTLTRPYPYSGIHVPGNGAAFQWTRWAAAGPRQAALFKTSIWSYYC